LQQTEELWQMIEFLIVNNLGIIINHGYSMGQYKRTKL